jgi:hypothetical protein
MKSLIGTELKEYAEKYFTYHTRRTVTRKDKPWLMNETFRWTETLNQKQPKKQPDKNRLMSNNLYNITYFLILSLTTNCELIPY